MAFQVQPPERFNFSQPTEWPRWRKQFERYCVVSGVAKKKEEEQIKLLMYLLGDKSDDIFRTFRFDEEADRKKLDKVIEKFESYFIVRRNIIFERARFNRRVQEEGEPIEEFITHLYKLAEFCEFKDLHDEMIRDRIVVGVRDKKISERLQLDYTLTLEKAITIVRQQEEVRKQQHEMTCESSQSSRVEYVGSRKVERRDKYEYQDRDSRSSEGPCARCSYTHWKGKQCPAREATCRKCDEKGHFARCCTRDDSKTETNDKPEVGVKETRRDSPISHLLEVTTSVNDDEKIAMQRRWTQKIRVNSTEVEFKLDSGADVTVIPYMLYLNKMKRYKLEPPDRRLRAADRKFLDCIGMIDGRLEFRGRQLMEKVYVARRLDRPLLSLMSSEKLNLIRRIEEEGSSETIKMAPPEIPTALEPDRVPADDLDKKGEMSGKMKKKKKKSKKVSDRRDGGKDLKPNDKVWIKNMKTGDKIEKKSEPPESNIVSTPRGQIRREKIRLKTGFNIPKEDDDPRHHREPEEDPGRNPAKARADREEEPDRVPRSRHDPPDREWML